MINKNDYLNKKRKLFKFIFFIPAILFLILCNIPLIIDFKTNFSIYGVIGEISIICIWFTISYILSSIIGLVLCDKNENVEADKEIMEKEETNNEVFPLNSEGKVFEYSAEKASTFNAMGEAVYLHMKKKAFLKAEGKKHIRNYFFILIILGFMIGIVFAISNMTMFVLYLLIFGLTLFTMIKRYCYKKGQRKITINQDGVIIQSNITVSLKWNQILLIGLTNNVLLIIPKDSPLLITIEPREEIFNEIKKYTDTKIIIDKL